MGIIRISGFAGENRAIQARLLADSVGVLSRNQKPGRGDLRPWREPLTVATVPGGRKTIYRMGWDVASDTNYWLSWTGRVHVVRGFNTEDTSEQTYFSGDGVPKVTNNLIGLASAPYPTASRPLSIPAPTSAPTVSVDSGSWTGSNANYYYVYTYVNDWGWESAPSPVSAEVIRKTDATATIQNFATAPAGNYNINRIRIYRTQSGSSGTASFYFLREIAYGVTSTKDDNRNLSETLPTTNWTATPDDLKCLTAMWNGMLAGISGNGVRFCVAYSPYAWPIDYEILPPDSKPVGLGKFGQTLLVLTTGRPLVVSGSSPEAMDQMPLEMYQACVSEPSIVSMGSGVAWASEDGLCWYGSGGARILTNGVMLREDWQKLRPSTIVGQMYEGLYLGSYDDGTGRKGFLIDPGNPTGIYFLDKGYEAMHFDELQDQLYVLDGGNIKRWDAGSTFMTVKHRSKVMSVPRPVNFAAGQVIADVFPCTVMVDALNLAESEVTKQVQTNPNLTAPTPTSLRFTKVATSPNPFRLPSGFAAQDWQLQAETQGDMQSFTIATTVNEIAKV